MSGKTILYVEDNEFNLKMVRQLLARTAYRLIEATDGELGVATALKEVPDLILMDIQLPKMSGLEATRQLRANPSTAAIPIIVITSFALSGDDQKAKDAGATAYITKPYSPRELLQTIRDLLPEQ
jgi:two-component system, cell cycle response regulator DivK